MAIDTTTFTELSGIEDLLTAPNDVTGGIFGVAIFGLIYLVLFVVLSAASARNGSPEPEKEAFLASSVIMAPLSYYLAVLDIMEPYLTIIPTVLSVVAIIVLTRKNS